MLGQLAGTSQPAADGTLVTRVYSGLAARAGISSTLLAQKGITGSRQVLQGEWGYYSTYARGKYDPESLVAGLGEKFHSVETSFKIYPCCGAALGTAEGVIELAWKYDIKPDNVEEVVISVVKGRGEDFTAFMSRPFEIRDVHQVNAIYSHQYIAASCLLQRSCLIEHFTDEYVRDPEVLKLLAKVKVQRVLDPPPGAFAPVRSEIITKDGKRYSTQVDYFKGSVFRPISKAEILEKFRRNVVNSRKTRKTLPPKVGEEIIKLVENLEELKNVNEVIKRVVA